MFDGKPQQGPGASPLVQVSPVPAAAREVPPLAPQSTASLPQMPASDVPQQVDILQDPDAVEAVTAIAPGTDPADWLELPEAAPPSDTVAGGDALAAEVFEVPEGAMPIPIMGEGHPLPEQVRPEPSDPVPQMRRYALPSPAVAGNPGVAVPVAMPVPFRRAVWIVSRGAGGLQASYSEAFEQPDLIDVQVNGIPIPVFAGQYLWMRVINAAVGDDLEISLILEPRGSGR